MAAGLNARCPDPKGWFLDPRTGERRERRCGRLRCAYCGPRLALSTANAIVLARPNSSGVLTTWGSDVPAEPTKLFRLFVGALNSVATALRAEGRVWEYVWTLELSDTRIPNAHVLQWGSGVSAARFKGAAFDAGMRWGDTQPIRHLPKLTRYVLKLPLAPLDLGLDGRECMELHLSLNGGKLVHSSRRFWRDGHGRPLPGLRAARVEARREARPKGAAPTRDDLARWRMGWNLPIDRLAPS